MITSFCILRHRKPPVNTVNRLFKCQSILQGMTDHTFYDNSSPLLRTYVLWPCTPFLRTRISRVRIKSGDSKSDDSVSYGRVGDCLCSPSSHFSARSAAHISFSPHQAPGVATHGGRRLDCAFTRHTLCCVEALLLALVKVQEGPQVVGRPPPHGSAPFLRFLLFYCLPRLPSRKNSIYRWVRPILRSFHRSRVGPQPTFPTSPAKYSS